MGAVVRKIAESGNVELTPNGTLKFYREIPSKGTKVK